MKIIFVHLGIAPIPNNAIENIKLSRKIAKNTQIYLITDRGNPSLDNFCIENQINLITTGNINESEQTKFFKKNSKLEKIYRGGLQYHSLERFFIIADFMCAMKFENVIHLENDYLIFFDPEKKESVFKEYANFSLPLDKTRSIPGIVWIKNSEAARNLTEFINENLHLDDMSGLAVYCRKEKEAKELPTIPKEYAIEKKLRENYFEAVDKFNGLFDAAGIGQYLGGIDWQNNPEDTRFFQNENSDLNMSEVNFQWDTINQTRKPFLSFKDNKVEILGIHVHSKKMHDFSIFETGVQKDENEYITGEKIQGLCDITISCKTTTNYHGLENIKTKEIIEIPENNEGKLEYINIDFINKVGNYKKIFLYTHLIPYFRKYIAPRLSNKYVLVTHNSDFEISTNELGLLNNKNLVAWYSQNVTFAHSKLHSLPIGLQNRQFGNLKIYQIHEQSKLIEKNKLIYVNFNKNTHSSRNFDISFLKKIPKTTIQENIDYQIYIKELASHKFVICPRGNGIDTHRFWEAQYLDTIPIILHKDWTASYSNLPLLIVNEWKDIIELDLEKIYIRITTKDYDRQSLQLSYINKKLNQIDENFN